MTLPFEDRSPDHQYQTLPDSIPREQIRGAERHPGAQSNRAHIIGSIPEQQGRGWVAQKLGVDLVVRGTVRAVNGSVEPGIEARNGRSGRLVWQNQFRQRERNLLALRQEVTMAVVISLPNG